MTKKRILLINPPIYDFTAYDFWMKPYGLLRAAGCLRGVAELRLFDFMDRKSPLVPATASLRSDAWGRGAFYSEPVEKPAVFEEVMRNWRRFGLPRSTFQAFLAAEGPFDAALVQTVMTYWYPGVREVLGDLRATRPECKIVLGGVYATLCAEHARALGADLVIQGPDLDPLWKGLGVSADAEGLPWWDDYRALEVGVLKLTDGCPFACSYCSAPSVYPAFAARPLERALREFDALAERGVEHIALYDDALLYRPQEILFPFLRGVRERRASIHFHCPNALNARFLDARVADELVRTGFKKIYLGFESRSRDWQRRTGGKLTSAELPRAIDNLVAAGLDREHLCAYLMLGHPESARQEVEASLGFVYEHGIRSMLADFSPIPGTPDGEACRKWIDLDEPLNHNKTAFPMRLLGRQEVERLKRRCRALNQKLGVAAS